MRKYCSFLFVGFLAFPAFGNPFGLSLPVTAVTSIYAGLQRVAQISSTQGTRYFTNDHLGSASLMTDTKGVQVQSMTYLPFGGTFQSSGTKPSAWRYTGQRQDDSTGLYYYNARYYDPTLGWFLTPDTIVQSPYDPQFLNRYTYCRNNPINLVDPTGHATVDFNGDGLYIDMGPGGGSGRSGNGSGGDNGGRSGDGDWGEGGGFGFSTGMGPLSSMGQFLGTADQRNDYMRAVTSVREAAERRAEQARQAAYAKAIADHYRAVGQAGLNGRSPLMGQGTILLVRRDASAFPVLWDGAGEGGAGGARSGAAGRGVSNPIPKELARIVPGRGNFKTLGPPSRSDVFVTAADDISGLNASRISQRLTINQADNYTVIRFQTPQSGLARPVNRMDPGFVGGGRTAGGALEFVILNGPIPAGSSIEVIK